LEFFDWYHLWCLNIKCKLDDRFGFTSVLHGSRILKYIKIIANWSLFLLAQMSVCVFVCVLAKSGLFFFWGSFCFSSVSSSDKKNKAYSLNEYFRLCFLFLFCWFLSFLSLWLVSLWISCACMLSHKYLLRPDRVYKTPKRTSYNYNYTQTHIYIYPHWVFLQEIWLHVQTIKNAIFAKRATQVLWLQLHLEK